MKFLIIIFACLTTSLTFAQSKIDKTPSISSSVRVGAVGVPHHYIQFGKNGSKFDYTTEGGQDIIFPFARFLVMIQTPAESKWVFQYVPLNFETRSVLTRDVVIDGATFPLGTNLRLNYNFPFYRIGYQRKVGDRADPLLVGGAIQIRNASIAFQSLDGTLLRVKQNVGPVPLITASWSCHTCKQPWFVNLATMYAPIKYINGSDNDVIGAFTDLEAGLHWQAGDRQSSDVIVSAGYLGGGASGTNRRDQTFSDGYSSNWIDLIFFSIGIERLL